MHFQLCCFVFTLKKTIMEASFKLIDGDFSVEEAKEIISNLLDFKINYHNVQSFGSEIRKGIKDERSLSRKENLIITKQQFLKYLENFTEDDVIKVYSEIQLKR